MKTLKIKTSAILAAIGIGMGLILSLLLLLFFPVLESDLVTFLLMLNIIMMAGNLFLFHFLIVFSSNLELSSKTASSVAVNKKKPVSKTTKRKTPAKTATKKTTKTTSAKTTRKTGRTIKTAKKTPAKKTEKK